MRLLKHKEGRLYLEGVSVLEAVGDQLPFGHLEYPHQLPATVLAAVERGEPLEATLQLQRKMRSTSIRNGTFRGNMEDWSMVENFAKNVGPYS